MVCGYGVSEEAKMAANLVCLRGEMGCQQSRGRPWFSAPRTATESDEGAPPKRDVTESWRGNVREERRQGRIDAMRGEGACEEGGPPKWGLKNRFYYGI